MSSFTSSLIWWLKSKGHIKLTLTYHFLGKVVWAKHEFIFRVEKSLPTEHSIVVSHVLWHVNGTPQALNNSVRYLQDLYSTVKHNLDQIISKVKRTCFCYHWSQEKKIPIGSSLGRLKPEDVISYSIIWSSLMVFLTE